MFSGDNNFIRFALGEYLRPGGHKVAMSVPELVSATNAFSTKNRPGCVPKLDKSNPKELFLQYTVKCDLKTSDPAGHSVKVQFDLSSVKDKATAKNLDVKVSCSCPAFLYWGAQWHLHQRDSLEGTPRPLLTAPTEKLDLRGHFIICKHCAAVFERILPAVQHNIVKILRQREVDQRAPNVPETNERLQREQEQMKKRVELRKQRDKKNKKIQEELLKGLKKREQDKQQPDVVMRDEPATSEEKQRVPALPPEEVAPPEPTPVAPPPPPEPVEPEPPVKTPVIERPPDTPAVPKKPEYKPQRMPEMGRSDRDAMQRLMREEQRRQQQQMNRRLKNNPGRR